MTQLENQFENSLKTLLENQFEIMPAKMLQRDTSLFCIFSVLLCFFALEARSTMLLVTPEIWPVKLSFEAPAKKV